MEEISRKRTKAVFLFVVFFIIITMNLYPIDVIKQFVWKEIKQLDRSKYQWQMYKWREAFLSGNFSSNNEIALKVFGKRMPSELSQRKRHTYPFYSMDTLRAWVDWEWEWTGDSIKDGHIVFVKTDFIME